MQSAQLKYEVKPLNFESLKLMDLHSFAWLHKEGMGKRKVKMI